MAKIHISIIATSEALSEEFFVKFFEQLSSDDELPCKKYSHLLAAWRENPTVVDNVLMALCGWSMESLADMAMGKPTE